MALSGFAARIYDHCNKYGLLTDTGAIVCGLSGGPDSVALISVLHELTEEYEDLPLIFAVHVNHGLRDNADDDEKLCIRLCEDLCIPLKVFHFDVRAESKSMGRGLEETGRLLRYRAFNEYADEISRDLDMPGKKVRIATAHHKGDLAETFMMNLYRGAGLDGLTAMTGDPGIIRPLLGSSKEEILRYLGGGNILFATDETNFQSDYTRNKWRNDIFPLIGEVSVKDPQEAVYDTYMLLKTDSDYLKETARQEYERIRVKEGGSIFIDGSCISGLHEAVVTRIIRMLWKDTFGSLTDFENKHVDIVRELAAAKDGTRYADMPFGRMCVCTEGLIGFCPGDGKDGLSCAMSTYMGFPAAIADPDIEVCAADLSSGPKTVFLEDPGVLISVSIVENNDAIVYNTHSWVCAADSLRITAQPLEGTFRRAGSPYSKDIRKILSDMKVPRDARSHLISVRKDDEILWIPGIGHAKGFISERSRELWLKEDGNSGKARLIKIELARKGDMLG